MFDPLKPSATSHVQGNDSQSCKDHTPFPPLILSQAMVNHPPQTVPLLHTSSRRTEVKRLLNSLSPLVTQAPLGHHNLPTLRLALPSNSNSSSNNNSIRSSSSKCRHNRLSLRIMCRSSSSRRVGMCSNTPLQLVLVLLPLPLLHLRHIHHSSSSNRGLTTSLLTQVGLWLPPHCLSSSSNNRHSSSNNRRHHNNSSNNSHKEATTTVSRPASRLQLDTLAASNQRTRNLLLTLTRTITDLFFRRNIMQ